MDSDLNSGYIRGHRFFQSCQVNSHLSFNTDQSTKLVTDEDDNLVLYILNQRCCTFTPDGVASDQTAFDTITVNTTDLVAGNGTVGIGTNTPDTNVELDIWGTARTYLLEFEKQPLVMEPLNTVIGDVSFIYSEFNPGFGVDNRFDPTNTDPTLRHDIRLWFPLERNKDAVVFNKAPDVDTAVLDLKKNSGVNQSVVGPVQSSIFTRFTVGSEFDDTYEVLGGIMSLQGHMGFYRDTTDITAQMALDTTQATNVIKQVDAIQYQVNNSAPNSFAGLDMVGFDFDDINMLTTAPQFKEEVTKQLNSRKLVVQTNMIPYMWAAIRNLIDRVEAIELSLTP